jgi:hypothetical protein
MEVRGFTKEEICRRAKINTGRFNKLHKHNSIPTKVEFRRIHMLMRLVPESVHKDLVSIYVEPIKPLDKEVSGDQLSIKKEAARIKDRITPRMHDILHRLRETQTESRGAIELWRAEASIATRLSKLDLTVKEEVEVDGRIRRMYCLTPLGGVVLGSLGRPV